MPLLLARTFLRRRKVRNAAERWYERLGLYANHPSGECAIWVHAVSVGEAVAAMPLIQRLLDERKEERVIVTTTTTTGAAVVARSLGDRVAHAYFPYDLPFAVRRFIRRFRPRLLLIIETELWPNTLAVCAEAGVQVILINARISARSFQRYQAIAAVTREMMRKIDRAAVQSRADAERIRDMGLPADKMTITGNLKFDVDLPPSLFEHAEALRRRLGSNRLIIALGSTRDGEEEILLPAIEQLMQEFPTLLTIIAPRHPERFVEVVELCRRSGHQVATHRNKESADYATSIYIVDEMGQLPVFYALADVAFVGGSLVALGGHNVLEPASVGTPIVVGPHTFNFSAICELLKEAGVLAVASDGAAFAAIVKRWLHDSNERDRMGELARALVIEHRGATARTFDLIAETRAWRGTQSQASGVS